MKNNKNHDTIHTRETLGEFEIRRNDSLLESLLAIEFTAAIDSGELDILFSLFEISSKGELALRLCEDKVSEQDTRW